MVVVIETLNGRKATWNGKVWVSDEANVAAILNATSSGRDFQGYEANPLVAEAEYIIEKFGGRIIESPVNEPLPEGAIP